MSLSIAVVSALVLLIATGRATIPEPDNVLYGNITLNSVLVTAARTDVVIEARRTTNGPAIASYRMGSDPALGNFYALPLLLESVSPVANANALEVLQTVFISVRDGSGLRAQMPFTVVERGVAQRMDFGAAMVDSDGDGLPDAWELHRYGNLSQVPLSVAANGLTAVQNFIAGTDPNAEAFRLQLTSAGGQKHVTFLARRAEGPGYEGMSRRYSLESRATLTGGAWVGVANYLDIPANNQVVDYVASGSGASAFFRGYISLLGYNVPGADSDGDGMPDAWEMLYFGNLNQNAGSPTANGQTAFQNFVAGTDPNAVGGQFKVSVALFGAERRVSFQAVRAQGPGYEGRQRFYSLESSASPIGPWLGVPGFTDLQGDNQSVTFQTLGTTSPIFYRGRTWLQP